MITQSSCCIACRIGSREQLLELYLRQIKVTKHDKLTGPLKNLGILLKKPPLPEIDNLVD